MLIDQLQRMMLFALLCLAQALVLNRIQLFHCATPLLYVYFAILFARNEPRWLIMVWCFLMGMTVDSFSNTPGLSAASMTLIGFLQPYLLELFLPRDAEQKQEVSARALGMGKFMILSTIMVLLYSLVFFTLETFSFFNALYWLACVLGSAMMTLVLIFAVESFRK